MKKNNDANITKSPFESNTENITEWFEDDDVLVVDRGFRDVIYLLMIKAYVLKCLTSSKRPKTTIVLRRLMNQGW